jgi:hypothetical protein
MIDSFCIDGVSHLAICGGIEQQQKGADPDDR